MYGMGLAVENHEANATEWNLEDLCLIADEEIVKNRDSFPVFLISSNRIVFVDQQRRDRLIDQGVRSIKLLDHLD